jgi:membrane protein implicated in regulation of membrane protease activity
MLGEQLFSETDNTALEKQARKFKLLCRLFIAADIVFGFFVAWMVEKKFGTFFWVFLLLFYALTFCLYYFFLRKIVNRYQEDKESQIKLIGNVIVSKKTLVKDRYSLEFDSEETRGQAVSKTTYERVQIGDMVHIEIGKYSGFLLSLSMSGDKLE